MPLNPLLYDRLRQLFGKVKIADEGSQFVATPGRDPATDRTWLNVADSGEYYYVDCPFCGDRGGRLWINHRFGTPEPLSGRPMLFVAICYNERCLDDYEKRRRLDDMIYGFRNRRDREAIRILPGHYEETCLGPATLPGECVPIQHLPPDHPAVQYMVRERRYPLGLLAYFQVSFCTEALPKYRPANGRIIIPINMDGSLVGWQARYVGDIDFKARGIPKYYSMPGMAKRQILYNYDVAKQYPFVVVTEGMTDVWATGPFAVALLGKTMSFAQHTKMIVNLAGKPIILMLDGGEEEELAMQHMLMQLACQPVLRCPVCYVRLPDGHDPGSYRQETLLNEIYAVAARSGITLPDRQSLAAPPRNQTVP